VTCPYLAILALYPVRFPHFRLSSYMNMSLFLSGAPSWFTSSPKIQWQRDPMIAAASTLQLLIIGLLILIVQRNFCLPLLVP
jgi:hypothetical protein